MTELWDLAKSLKIFWAISYERWRKDESTAAVTPNPRYWYDLLRHYS